MDVLEQMTDAIGRGLDINKNFAPPQKHKNNGGQDIFGYPANQIPKEANKSMRKSGGR